MKKFITCSLFTFLLCAVVGNTTSVAQNANNNNTTVSPGNAGAGASGSEKAATSNPELYKTPIYKRPLTVSAFIGTQGIGVSGRLAITPKWRVRLGYAYTPIVYTTDLNVAGFNSHLGVYSHFNNVHLLAEFRPFLTSSFRFVAGLSYFFDSKMNVDLDPKSNYSYGNITLTPKDLGSLKATLDYSGIAPYLGFGIFKGQPAPGKFAVNMDFGTYMLSSPKTTVTGSKLLADPQVDTKQLDKNIEGWRWLPVVQLNVSYRIKMKVKTATPSAK